MVIALDEKPFPLAARASAGRPALEKWRLQLQGCAVAVALCAIITLVAMQWLMAFEAANLVMLYLLGGGAHRPWSMAAGRRCWRR